MTSLKFPKLRTASLYWEIYRLYIGWPRVFNLCSLLQSQTSACFQIVLLTDHLNVKSLISGNNLQSFAYEVSLFLLDHWNAQRLGLNCAPSVWTTGWQSKFNSVGTLFFWGLHPAKISSKLKWREDKAHGLVSSLWRIWFGVHLKCMQVDFKVGDCLTLNSLWSSLQRLNWQREAVTVLLCKRFPFRWA